MSIIHLAQAWDLTETDLIRLGVLSPCLLRQEKHRTGRQMVSLHFVEP